MKRQTSAAALLRRKIASAKGSQPKPITDTFAQAVGHRLESRGITDVPGLPQPEAPQWYDLAIESHRRNQEITAKQEARRFAEEKAQTTPQSTAGLLHDAISERRPSPLPLNGTGVLKAALVGGSGTINGGNR